MECPVCGKELKKALSQDLDLCVLVKCECGYRKDIQEDVIVEFNIKVKYRLLCSTEELNKVKNNEGLFLQEIINTSNFEQISKYTYAKIDDKRIFWKE